MWLAWPTAALQRLCQVFSCIEQTGVWPQSCLHWRTVFIPKGSAQDRVSRVDKVRPISIANLLYRVWASHVTSQLSRFVAPPYAPGQGGGFEAPDPECLLLDLQLEPPAETHGVAVALSTS